MRPTHLQAAASHAKPHAVHVDVVGKDIPRRTAIVSREVLFKRSSGVGILEDWEGITDMEGVTG